MGKMKYLEKPLKQTKNSGGGGISDEKEAILSFLMQLPLAK